MAETNSQKQLRIKTGALKRLHKEYLSYVKESDDQQKRIDQLKASGADEYTVKKQIEVLEDTKQMIPNCKGRLEGGYEDLSSWIEEHGEDEGLEEHLVESKDLLTTIQEFLENVNQTSSPL